MTDPVVPAAIRPRQAAGLSDQALEELNRLWTVARAFSNTAHDVNNALQVIAGSAELLEARDLDPAVRRRVEIIRQESGKAAVAINRLLDFARAPRQPVDRVDVRPLVDGAVSMRLASAGRSRIALTVQRAGAVPAWIVAEPAKVTQALLNLLLVAEARVGGRPKARIEVSVENTDGVAVVVVASCEDVQGAADGADQWPVPEGLTQDAEIWAASYLAALHGGVLTADGMALTVRWPRAI